MRRAHLELPALRPTHLPATRLTTVHPTPLLTRRTAWLSASGLRSTRLPHTDLRNTRLSGHGVGTRLRLPCSRLTTLPSIPLASRVRATRCARQSGPHLITLQSICPAPRMRATRCARLPGPHLITLQPVRPVSGMRTTRLPDCGLATLQSVGLASRMRTIRCSRLPCPCLATLRTVRLPSRLGLTGSRSLWAWER